jgi:hypothetical protein
VTRTSHATLRPREVFETRDDIYLTSLRCNQPSCNFGTQISHTMSCFPYSLGKHNLWSRTARIDTVCLTVLPGVLFPRLACDVPSGNRKVHEARSTEGYVRLLYRGSRRHHADTSPTASPTSGRWRTPSARPSYPAPYREALDGICCRVMSLTSTLRAPCSLVPCRSRQSNLLPTAVLGTD